MATTRRIQLTRYGLAIVNWQYYGNYRLRIEVTAVEGEDLDPYIFIYRRKPVNPYLEKNCDDFCAVAGPAQIASIPPVEPDPDNNYPWYRLNYIEHDFTSEQQALEVWNIIKAETCILVEGMGKFSQLQPLETHWCPDAPDETAESESASESMSVSV